MESFATIVNIFEPLTIVARLSILDIWGDLYYVSERFLIFLRFGQTNKDWFTLDWINTLNCSLEEWPYIIGSSHLEFICKKMSSKFSQNSQKNTYHGALQLQAWVADCKSERYQKRSPIHALYCPTGIYLLKVNNRNTSQWRLLVSLLLILNIFHTLF